MTGGSLIVVDASVAVKWFISEEWTPQADALLADHQDRSLVVPPHFTWEVANALYRRAYRHTNPITPARSRQALAALLSLEIPTLEPPTLYQAAYDLAESHGIPRIYDCLYVSLARTIAAEFWTADQNLINTGGAAMPWVRFIGDYPQPPA